MPTLKQTDAFRKWERQLKDNRARAAIAARLNRLTHGLRGDMKPVGQGVSELRIHYGPGYRIYLKERGAEIIILLCGGDKGSQQRDIRLAKELAVEWDNSDG